MKPTAGGLYAYPPVAYSGFAGQPIGPVPQNTAAFGAAGPVAGAGAGFLSGQRGPPPPPPRPQLPVLPEGELVPQVLGAFPAPLAPVTRVRKEFPKAWIWTDVNTGYGRQIA